MQHEGVLLNTLNLLLGSDSMFHGKRAFHSVRFCRWLQHDTLSCEEGPLLKLNLSERGVLSVGALSAELAKMVPVQNTTTVEATSRRISVTILVSGAPLGKIKFCVRYLTAGKMCSPYISPDEEFNTTLEATTGEFQATLFWSPAETRDCAAVASVEIVTSTNASSKSPPVIRLVMGDPWYNVSRSKRYPVVSLHHTVGYDQVYPDVTACPQPPPPPTTSTPSRPSSAAAPSTRQTDTGIIAIEISTSDESLAGDQPSEGGSAVLYGLAAALSVVFLVCVTVILLLVSRRKIMQKPPTYKPQFPVTKVMIPEASTAPLSSTDTNSSSEGCDCHISAQNESSLQSGVSQKVLTSPLPKPNPIEVSGLG